jgi:hypothetical protein
VKATLRRESPRPGAKSTAGLLFVDDLTLVTIERPWIPAADPRRDRGGAKNRSCVPLGVYKLVRHNSEAHPMTWALVNHELDVVHYEGDDHDPDEDRATCLLHVANYVHNVIGCIGPGTRAEMDPRFGYCVRESRKAMELIRQALPWTDGHTLEIVEAA